MTTRLRAVTPEAEGLTTKRMWRRVLVAITAEYVVFAA